MKKSSGITITKSGLKADRENPFSGMPRLRRACIQRAMNYAALWPVETRWAYSEFANLCAFLGMQIVIDEDGVIWFEPIQIERSNTR